MPTRDDAPSASPAIVTIRGVCKTFGNFTALKDIDLDIRRGEILTLLGPSGCGKSTLMRIIAGFEPLSRGALLLNGRDMAALPPEKRPVNMVFQRYALFPHLDVFDNIAFGLRLKNLPEAEIGEKVRAMMRLVQIESLAERWTTEISGGQCQRVALARALVNEPEVLLLDEPLAALDLKIRQLMLVELKRIQETTGTTFVFVTHDQDEAMVLSSRIALMDKGEVVQVGTPDDLYFRPNSMFSARFLGETNVIPGRVHSAGSGRVSVESPAGLLVAQSGSEAYAAGEEVNIVVRPEAIAVSASAAPGVNGCKGRIGSLAPIGGRVIITVALDDGTTIRSQQPRVMAESDLHPGKEIYLSWPDSSASIIRK